MNIPLLLNHCTKMKDKSYDELISELTDYLKNELKLKDSSIYLHRIRWRKIKEYMLRNKIKYITPKICMDYLHEKFGEDYLLLSANDKTIISKIKDLMQFYETGGLERRHEPFLFDGSIGLLMTEYLSKKITERRSERTVSTTKTHLYYFLKFLNEHNVEDIREVNECHILNFLKTINPNQKASIDWCVNVLRGFFREQYNQQRINNDYSKLIPKTNYKRQAKIPDIYTEKEIGHLLGSINRSSAVGKRDYAITLLVAKLGLRTSDISLLKFKDIDWEQNKIQIIQYKTDTQIVLPLLPEIGNAIIDYIKHGRPKSDEPFIFLLAKHPFTPLQLSGASWAIDRNFKRSGINIASRKHGSHSLRHSLAGYLLKTKIVLPTITAILGHNSMDSTKYYLRIDLESLKQCMLDVPAISTDFYNQKGGYFYE